MKQTGCKKKSTEKSIKGMLTELKDLLEKDSTARSDRLTDDVSDGNSKISETQYFTFLGSNNKRSSITEDEPPADKNYSSEKLGEFFKIHERGHALLSSKLESLKAKGSLAINKSLKHKISDKIFKL